MRVIVAISLIGLTSAPVAAAPSLVAHASASPRPSACVPAARSSSWSRLRAARVRSFCVALARGYSLLSTEPKRARASADKAARLATDSEGRAAVEVLKGRTALGLGSPIRAKKHFDQAIKLHAAALEPALVLYDAAVAALLSGHGAEAARLFRKVVPRASLLGSRLPEGQVYLEAAFAVMSEGPDGLREALTYLRSESLRRAGPELRPYVEAARALARDRQGVAQKGGRVDDAPLVILLRRLEAAEPSLGVPHLPRAEIHALIGIVAEADSPSIAAEHWSTCVRLAPEGSAWSRHARAKLSALKGRR